MPTQPKPDQSAPAEDNYDHAFRKLREAYVAYRVWEPDGDPDTFLDWVEDELHELWEEDEDEDEPEETDEPGEAEAGPFG